MASGDLLAAWLPGQNDFPAANAAVINRDANYGFFLQFDDTTDDAAIFTGLLSDAYDGGGVAVEVVYLMEAATSGAVVLGAALQNIDDGQDLSGSVSWDENTATQTVPASAETVEEASISFTDGTDMDSVAASGLFRLRIRRVGSNASDSASDDLRCLCVRIKEV